MTDLKDARWVGRESSCMDAYGEIDTAKKIPMRFGYPDGSPGKHSHMMIARCPQTAAK